MAGYFLDSDREPRTPIDWYILSPARPLLNVVSCARAFVSGVNFVSCRPVNVVTFVNYARPFVSMALCPR